VNSNRRFECCPLEIQDATKYKMTFNGKKKQHIETFWIIYKDVVKYFSPPFMPYNLFQRLISHRKFPQCHQILNYPLVDYMAWLKLYNPYVVLSTKRRYNRRRKHNRTVKWSPLRKNCYENLTYTETERNKHKIIHTSIHNTHFWKLK